MKRSLPCVLALSGLDPGGGAGLLADVRAITAAGAFACGVVTVQTTQSTSGLLAAQAVSAHLWRAQARVVLAHQRVGAIKVGALDDLANVRAVAGLLRDHARLPVVIDPVLAPTRGTARLLGPRALAAMRFVLVPLATLVTANAPEAAALTGAAVTNVEEATAAAHALVRMGARAALVKGGHLTGARATDVLVVGSRASRLGAARLRLPKGLHGAGCTLASLIAARLALGHGVLAAVQWAKRAHHRALASAVDVGGDLLVVSMNA